MSLRRSFLAFFTRLCMFRRCLGVFQTVCRFSLAACRFVIAARWFVITAPLFHLTAPEFSITACRFFITAASLHFTAWRLHNTAARFIIAACRFHAARCAPCRRPCVTSTPARAARLSLPDTPIPGKRGRRCSSRECPPSHPPRQPPRESPSPACRTCRCRRA